MTPTPMARAVEAVRETDYHSVCGCTDQMHKNVCYEAMLRAALPALLEAVMGVVDVSALRERMEVAGLSPYHKDREDHARAALLAALTTAAGRVG